MALSKIAPLLKRSCSLTTEVGALSFYDLYDLIGLDGVELLRAPALRPENGKTIHRRSLTEAEVLA